MILFSDILDAGGDATAGQMLGWACIAAVVLAAVVVLLVCFGLYFVFRRMRKMDREFLAATERIREVRENSKRRMPEL
jgi:uncharacterized membrane protein